MHSQIPCYIKNFLLLIKSQNISIVKKTNKRIITVYNINSHYPLIKKNDILKLSSIVYYTTLKGHVPLLSYTLV